jgi:small-conductance mechanosensitive channel
MGGTQLRDAIVMSTMGLWKGLWAKMVAFIPNVLGALVLLAVGYVLAKLARHFTTALLQRIGFDRASSRIGLHGILEQANIRLTAGEIIGHIIFWLLMLTFLVSASETLGLPNVSQTIDAFVLYLPNVIGAAVIVVVGMTVASFVRDLVRSAAGSLGVDYAKALGSLAHGALLVVIASLAVGQLQIETVLLNRVVQIILIAAALALALAMGLGTRDIAAHIVAGVYLRDVYRPGMKLSMGENAGTVEEVGTIVTRLATDDGRSVFIPNGQLTAAVVNEGGAAKE